MEGKELEKFLQYRDKCNESLGIKVKLSWKEVLKIVVKDLIAKRNGSSIEHREHFDKVLIYYIGECDFKKYVLDGRKIK